MYLHNDVFITSLYQGQNGWFVCMSHFYHIVQYYLLFLLCFKQSAFSWGINEITMKKETMIKCYELDIHFQLSEQLYYINPPTNKGCKSWQNTKYVWRPDRKPRQPEHEKPVSWGEKRHLLNWVLNPLSPSLETFTIPR